MPYYVYKVQKGPSSLVRNLELQDEFESYKDARDFARSMRAEQGNEAEYTVKVVFAENRLGAEERLQELREAPILREWEK